MPTELKPCPFCGGEASIIASVERGVFGLDYEKEYALCMSCGARGGVAGSFDAPKHQRTQKVINAWNKRVQEPKKRKKKGISYIPYLNKEKTDDQI